MLIIKLVWNYPHLYLSVKVHLLFYQENICLIRKEMDSSGEVSLPPYYFVLSQWIQWLWKLTIIFLFLGWQRPDKESYLHIAGINIIAFCCLNYFPPKVPGYKCFRTHWSRNLIEYPLTVIMGLMEFFECWKSGFP